MNLPFRLSLSLFEIHQNREVWPPKLPIHKCGISVVNQMVIFTFLSNPEINGRNSELTSSGFSHPQRHFHPNPEAHPLLLPPEKTQKSYVNINSNAFFFQDNNVEYARANFA